MASRLVLSLGLFFGWPAWAAEVAGVKLDGKARVAGSELALTEKPVQEDLKKALLGVA